MIRMRWGWSGTECAKQRKPGQRLNTLGVWAEEEGQRPRACDHTADGSERPEGPCRGAQVLFQEHQKAFGEVLGREATHFKKTLCH